MSKKLTAEEITKECLENKDLLNILQDKINITHTAFRGKYFLDWEDIVEIYRTGAKSRLQSVDELKELCELAEKLPDKLLADWRNTNHYELTSDEVDGYWWLVVRGALPRVEGKMPCETEEGKRLGLLLDIAEKLKKAEPILRQISVQ